MRPHDCARHRKAKPGAAGFKIARRIQPAERRKRVFEKGFRNSRPLVIDADQNKILSLLQRHPSQPAIFDRVFHQISDRAAQRRGAAFKHDPARHFSQGDIRAGVLNIVADPRQKRAKIDGFARLGRGILADEGQGRGDHMLHVIQITVHFGTQLVVLDKFGAQPQTGDRGAQIMGNRRQHLGAVLDKIADAGLDHVECVRGAPNHQRPGLGDRGRAHIGAKFLGGVRQLGDGPGHAAHDHRRNGHHRNQHH